MLDATSTADSEGQGANHRPGSDGEPDALRSALARRVGRTRDADGRRWRIEEEDRPLPDADMDEVHAQRYIQLIVQAAEQEGCKLTQLTEGALTRAVGMWMAELVEMVAEANWIATCRCGIIHGWDRYSDVERARRVQTFVPYAELPVEVREQGPRANARRALGYRT